MAVKTHWTDLNFPKELRDILSACPSARVVDDVEQLVGLSCGSVDSDFLNVEYKLPGNKTAHEATVARVRNGIAVNYTEPYMRRRDPESMVIADEKPSDKTRFEERFGQDFSSLRQETFDWMKQQELALFIFQAGLPEMGEYAVAVVPANAAFFALGLAYLQGLCSPDELPDDFDPHAVIYVAPPFRHTHLKGRQVVVHNRTDSLYEMFSYNLYPGPSAKKGVYGMLIGIGEREGWVTAHCSTVQVVTPYDNITTTMHEGASGSGKSEMLEHAHRLSDGRLLMGKNLVTGENRYLEIPRSCDLRPVTDDMAICHPGIQQPDGRLWVTDAEDAWFMRVDHIKEYGTDLDLEKLTARPEMPLVFLNIDTVPGGRAMIWEHIEDEPGKLCPNPRAIIPRKIVPDVVHGPVGIDIRSFGVRTPPCTKEKPTYGILGLLQILPPSLAWLWRLVAPRGFANPSIVDTEGISSEGVGSYWPFATGRRVPHANLLLEQIESTPKTRYILVPNQHVGCWRTGFMPQWIAREYLARRGHARFQEGHTQPARCPLLGHAMFSMRVEGTQIPHWLLEVNTQPEVGEEAYDKGAEILKDFFKKTLQDFMEPDLCDKGRAIVECCMDDGSLDEYISLL